MHIRILFESVPNHILVPIYILIVLDHDKLSSIKNKCQQLVINLQCLNYLG